MRTRAGILQQNPYFNQETLEIHMLRCSPCEIMVNWHESSETLTSKVKERTLGLFPARQSGGMGDLFGDEHESGLKDVIRVFHDLLRNLIKQIFHLESEQGNLISNPVKFTQKSLMVVDTQTFHRADKQPRNCSKEQIPGIGLLKELQRRPFQKFSQADSYSSLA